MTFSFDFVYQKLNLANFLTTAKNRSPRNINSPEDEPKDIFNNFWFYLIKSSVHKWL